MLYVNTKDRRRRPEETLVVSLSRIAQEEFQVLDKTTADSCFLFGAEDPLVCQVLLHLDNRVVLRYDPVGV